MKIIYIVLISIIFIFSILAQENPQKKNATNSQSKYSKEKAEQVKALNKEIDNKENKIFGTTKNSGSEIKLKKDNNQNLLSNEDLKKKLNNPRKLKKKK